MHHDPVAFGAHSFWPSPMVDALPFRERRTPAQIHYELDMLGRRLEPQEIQPTEPAPTDVSTTTPGPVLTINIPEYPDSINIPEYPERGAATKCVESDSARLAKLAARWGIPDDKPVQPDCQPETSTAYLHDFSESELEGSQPSSECLPRTMEMTWKRVGGPDHA